MNRPPAFQFYPDKWMSHTERLSDAAYRVFHKLLCWMWQHSPDYCSIDASPAAVSCALGLPLETATAAMSEIQNPFGPLLKIEGDKWVSNGLRKERDKQERRSRAGYQNVQKRYGRTTTVPKSVTTEQHQDSIKSTSPDTMVVPLNTKTPTTVPDDAFDTNESAYSSFLFKDQYKNPPIIPPPTPGQNNTDFDAFWSAYPRKVGKEAARKAWKTHKPNIDNILQALEWQTKQDQWLKDGGQYIPHPATYLNQGRWQDAQPQALTNNPQKPFSAANPDDPEFQRRVNDYLSGNPHQSYSEAVEVIRQTDPTYRRPPLKIRISEYRAAHPDASYLDAIERVGSPAEVADYMQHLRAQVASSREPGQVESVGGVLDSLGVKLPPQAE